ncbi:MAG: AMP-binding protein [Bacteroidales bacterium]
MLYELTLGQWLEKWANETPDKDFIVYSDRNLRFSYRMFNERVDRLAKSLMAIGVKNGDHVGIWATNVPDWNTFMFATAKIGAVLVTINTNYKQTELEYLVGNADLHTICITDGTFDSDYPKMIYEMLPELKQQPRGKINSERYPFLKNVVFIGQEKYRGMYNTSELMLLSDLISEEQFDLEKSKVKANDIVNMQYTSGTTGFPKGVMLSHFNITNNGYSIGQCMRFTSEECLCLPVPLFHCFGIVLGMMAVVTHGAKAVLLEKFDPLVVLASVHKERCTALYGVPTMYIAELNHPMFSMFDLSSLRTGIMAGSLCPQWLMEEVMSKMNMKEITSVYGLTEASPGMTQSHVDDSMEVRSATVGRELPHIEVKVIDPETGRECPDGVQGEMCCRGYNIMKGYYKMPEATAEILDENGFLHSGDLGVKRKDGNFCITGRIKDMIIRGGENIYPREIEEFLYKMEGVQDVQVAAVPSKKYGEEIGAFIILKEGFEISEGNVKEFCRGAISRHKIPKYIFFVQQFPMTGSGKIQKYKLKDLSLELLAAQGVVPV